jgi:hypothetical protein
LDRSCGVIIEVVCGGIEAEVMVCLCEMFDNVYIGVFLCFFLFPLVASDGVLSGAVEFMIYDVHELGVGEFVYFVFEG